MGTGDTWEAYLGQADPGAGLDLRLRRKYGKDFRVNVPEYEDDSQAGVSEFGNRRYGPKADRLVVPKPAPVFFDSQGRIGNFRRLFRRWRLDAACQQGGGSEQSEGNFAHSSTFRFEEH